MEQEKERMADGTPTSTTMTASYLAADDLYNNIKPYILRIPPPSGIPCSNIKVSQHKKIPVLNVRGQEQKFSLETNGFQFVAWPLVQNLNSDAGLKAHITATEVFLKEYLGADDVHLFEHKFRQRPPEHGDLNASALAASEPDIRQYSKPGSAVHSDQTGWSAKKRIKRHVPEHARRYLRGRFQTFNVWRPLLDEPLQDSPLALCDSSSLTDEDLVETDLVYEGYEGENYRVKFNPEHRWYYWHGQTKDEVILFKNYDSESNIRCAHTAFQDPKSPPGATPRISLELRVIVFNELSTTRED